MGQPDSSLRARKTALTRDVILSAASALFERQSSGGAVQRADPLIGKTPERASAA